MKSGDNKVRPHLNYFGCWMLQLLVTANVVASSLILCASVASYC
jgi:hypothetical protein